MTYKTSNLFWVLLLFLYTSFSWFVKKPVQLISFGTFCDLCFVFIFNQIILPDWKFIHDEINFILVSEKMEKKWRWFEGTEFIFCERWRVQSSVAGVATAWGLITGQPDNNMYMGTHWHLLLLSCAPNGFLLIRMAFGGNNNKFNGAWRQSPTRLVVGAMVQHYRWTIPATTGPSIHGQTLLSSHTPLVKNTSQVRWEKWMS